MIYLVKYKITSRIKLIYSILIIFYKNFKKRENLYKVN